MNLTVTKKIGKLRKKSSRKKSGRQKSRQKIDRPHKTAKKEPPDKISQTQQKKPRQKKKIVEKPAQEIKWHFDRKKLIATIPFAIALILFLWVWTEPGPRVLDPWFAAAMLVDSSKKIVKRYESIKNKKDYGKKNNYIIIFGATEQGSILYGQEKKDLY